MRAPPGGSDLEELRELDTAFSPFTLRVNDDDDGSLDVREFDPVNLVFPDTLLERVLAAFDRAGWLPAASGAVQSLRLGDELLIEQSAQYALYDEDDRRYHVRFWALPDPAVLAAVHHEHEYVVDGRIRHRLDAGFEVAEAFVVGHLLGSGEFERARRARLAEQGRRQARYGDDSGWRGWENHPRASVLYEQGVGEGADDGSDADSAAEHEN